MARDTPLRALVTLVLTATVCSFFVSASVVLLRPIQLNNELLKRSGNVLVLTGLLPPGGQVDDEQLLDLFKGLDARVIDIDEAAPATDIDPWTFDARAAASDPELGVAIPAGKDPASLGRRSRFETLYLVWKDGGLDRVVLPVRGAGMWSMIYGYIAVEADFNTIAGMVIYEQNETPGLGDMIAKPYWQSKWVGKKLYDDEGDMLFRVAEGPVQAGAAGAEYEVDALTGATITANAVTAMMRYWFGPGAYGPLLKHWREKPPQELN